MALTLEQRIELGLDDPALLNGEFSKPPENQPVSVTRVPNLKLVLKEGEKATAPKIRTMVNELLAGNMDTANYWLQQVGAANPKIALELYIEMMQFAMPKLKAVAVQVDDRSENPKSLSFADLERALVSDQ